MPGTQRILQLASWAAARPASTALGVLAFSLVALLPGNVRVQTAQASKAKDKQRWIGSWGAAPQLALKDHAQTYQDQTLRLIVHVSTGGQKVRIRLSNAYGQQPVVIGSAHIAKRTRESNIDPASDRQIKFDGKTTVTIAAHALATSDAADFDLSPLSDLSVSLFLPGPARAETIHILALQTSYVAQGDLTGAGGFPESKTISNWPFLVGVDVAAPAGGTIVAFGSSTTDGDGSSKDANRRWPDVLAERLEKAGYRDLGVVNQGVIGNRLLSDFESPRQAGGPLAETFQILGPSLGDSGVRRFERDVLQQPGAKYVILLLGINDVLFPGSFISAGESLRAQQVIEGNRQLIRRARERGMRAIGTTIPPFEHATFQQPFFDGFYTPEKEAVRQAVNEWIRNGKAFDGVIDLDEVVRDPKHPTQLSPAYDSGDHLHVNDAGNVAQGNAIPLALFRH
jgi:lysophospholipase L1-like esterase